MINPNIRPLPPTPYCGECKAAVYAGKCLCQKEATKRPPPTMIEWKHLGPDRWQCSHCGKVGSSVDHCECFSLIEKSAKQNDTQAPPVPNDREGTWEAVIRDLGSNPDPDLIASLRERDAMGLARYGVRLQPHNGRDSVVDAWDEARDLLVYSKNALIEATGTARASELMGVYVCAREAVIRLHRIIKAK